MRGLACLAAIGLAVGAQAAPPADPLASPNWPGLATTLFGRDPVRFDDRIHVRFPAIAENQHEFPVEVDARGVAGVKRLLIFADLNPIPLAVDFTPGRSQPFLSIRIKLDQRTPVRGAVQLADGSWLVSGNWIDAAGGGCSAPPVSRVKGDWAQHLGEVRGGAWAEQDGARVRLAFRHPMDTGFVANIPTYNLETVKLTGADGADYGSIEMEAAVAEDPAVTLLTTARAGDVLRVSGRDTNGIDSGATLRVSSVLAAR